MYCKNCGKEVRSTDAVCEACGTSVGAGTKFCQNCGAPLKEGAKFCMNCGMKEQQEIPKAAFCPNCGASIPAGATFCASCGVNLAGNPNPNPNPNANASVPAGQQKSKLAAGLLGIFLGGLGIHNFYLGQNKRGLTQLLVSCLTCGIGAFPMQIWGLVEGVFYLIGREGYTTDANGVPLGD